ncbi:MAG: zinc ribbon domain-containing protein [Candidatus Bathyarchaeota archaeon]|nr:zinc ribbon domain-containing protein [Candidatus Bathyarchaeota archaeon]
MSYCPKCGNKVDEKMTFCPRCGAALKMEAAATPAPPPTYRKNEKAEKAEKGEKNEKNEPEKGEKHEKGEFGYISWLIGGIVVIVIGLLAYARAVNFIRSEFEGPVMLLIIGVVIIIVAVWLSTMARRRQPRPA